MDKVKVLPPDMTTQYLTTATEHLIWIETVLGVKFSSSFAEVLHDGTVLCQLAIKFQPGFSLELTVLALKCERQIIL